MPTWLAIAIPSVVAVAAILMWALDYSKKAHEIAKLRLELEKLRQDAEKAEREEQSRASGLYKPTAAEVDQVRRDHVVWGEPARRLPPASVARSGCADSRSAALLLVGGVFIVYSVVRLIMDLVHLASRLW